MCGVRKVGGASKGYLLCCLRSTGQHVRAVSGAPPPPHGPWGAGGGRKGGPPPPPPPSWAPRPPPTSTLSLHAPPPRGAPRPPRPGPHPPPPPAPFQAMGENLHDSVEGETEDSKTRRLKLIAAVEGDDWSEVISQQVRCAVLRRAELHRAQS